MRKFFSRIGRVTGRLARPLVQLRSTGKLILAALGLFSAGAVGQNWPAVKLWLVAEWTHWGVVALGLLFLCAIAALYGMEKESDALRVVQVRTGQVKTSLRPVLHFSNNRDEHDIFIYEVQLKFRNDSGRSFRAFFPALELFRRKGWWRWEQLKLRRLDSYVSASMYQRGLPNDRDQWYEDHRYEIDAGDESVAQFYVMETAPEGASAFLGRDFKLRATIDFIGQPKETIEIRLPRVTDEYYVDRR